MNKTILALLITISFIDVYAQWNTSPYLNTAICTATFKQRELRIDSDSDGGAFIVWRDYRTGTVFDESDIYIQKIDSNGYAKWTLNGAAICVLPSNQSTPTLTSDEKGGVIIAWTDRRTGVADIYAQRIDANGNILWNLNGVPVCDKTLKEHSPKIISDDNSGAIVVWEDERTDSTFNIWAQRIDSNGNVVWTDGGISVCTQDSNRINHKVQRDGNGGAIITWQDGRNGEGDYDIWAQHIDTDGNFLWTTNGIAICSATGNQTNPKIDPEKSSNGIFVSWQDERNGTDYDIYANRIDSNGTLLWGTNGKPVVIAPNNQSALDFLSNNKTEGLIVTWKDKRSTEYDIYVQKLDLDGNPVWQTNGLLVCGALGDQINPNIISDKNGGAIIVWQDERGFDWDIYAQRVSYNGNMIWQENGEAVSLATGDQDGPKSIPDNKGGVIVAWEDKRDGVSKDIYAHHLLIVDTVSYPADTLLNGINAINSIAMKVFPNPFHDVLNVSLKSDVEVKQIQILNVLGEIVYQKDVFENTKNITIQYGLQNLNRGIYFLKISDGFASKTVFIEKVE